MIDQRLAVAFPSAAPAATVPVAVALNGTDRPVTARPAATPAPADAEQARTHLEVQLAGIWTEILKVPRIGRRCDFFDLGGDSLLATEMLHRVEQECGCRVDPARVLTGLTIERLATEVLAGSRETLSHPVVQIQAGDSRAPFFFLHNDAVSGGFYCRRIARALGANVTMYAVQPHGLNGTPFSDSIEDMAADRVKSILEVKPAGPYRIGGFCGGGVLAYEVARQLAARGEQVENLLLIDAVAPQLEFRALWAQAQRISRVLRLSPATQRALFRRLKWYQEDLRAAGRSGPGGWLALMWDKLRAAMRPAAHDAASAADPRAEDLRTRIWREFHQRSSVYIPEDFPGRLTLFRSTYMDIPRAVGAADRWKMLTTGVDVHSIPGDHFTCVTLHAAELAERMRPYLQD